MTTINLKDFYPWYTHDEYIEVSEEVADELRASRLYEAAYPVATICKRLGYSKSKVESMLHRTRSKLKKQLMKGISPYCKPARWI